MKRTGSSKASLLKSLAVLGVGFLLPALALVAAIPQAERDALMALYETTGGPSWAHNANWGGPPGTENTWYGVITDPENMTVVGLRLKGNNLSGALPQVLGDLANLEEVDFSQNQLEGTAVTVEEVTLSTLPPGQGERALADQAADDQPVINGVAFKLHVENGVVLVCKLTLTGSNFQSGCTVKINGQPAPKSVFTSETQVIAKGGAKLKKMLPKGQTLLLTVTNPDGLTSNPYSWERP